MRKRLRKILFVTAAVILLLSVSFWGYIQYKIADSYKTKIPQSATAIIKVNVYGIYKSMLGDLLRGKSGRKATGPEGISVPANIFLYTLQGKSSTTVFSSLPLDNSKEFNASLQTGKIFNAMPSNKPGIHFFVNASKTVTLAFSESRFAFAYAVNKEDVREELINILQDKNMVAVSTSKFKDIREQEGHLSFRAGSHTGNINFNKGSLVANIILSGKDWTIPTRVMHPQIAEESNSYMWLYADFAAFLSGKNYKVGKFSISGDSLLAAHPKGITLEIGKSVLQKDSIVTYDYNDDFEKVATTAVHETSIPGMSCVIDANSKLLAAYLQREGVMSSDSAALNKDAFALYKVYTTATDSSLLLRTSKQQRPVNPKVPSGDFFNLHLSFEVLAKQNEFALIAPYVKPYKQLHAKATKVNQQQILLEATLLFKDDQKHALWQLLESFESL